MPLTFTQIYFCYLTRYLQNGNILAAHTFITHFTATLISRYPSRRYPSESTSLSVGSPENPSGEVTLTTDPVLNFCQLAVLTCQRAQGDRNKATRESWVRLCGTYQSKGGVLASPPVRTVRFFLLPTRIPLPHIRASINSSSEYFNRHCKSCHSYTSPSRHPALRMRTHSGICCRRYLLVDSLVEAPRPLLDGCYPQATLDHPRLGWTDLMD